MSVLPYLVVAWLFGIGLYGVITSRHYVHTIICLAVMQGATYVLLLSVGYVSGGQAPIFADLPGTAVVVDPVVQALCLTDVVVEATVVCLLLALVLQAAKRYGTVDPDRLREMHD